MEILRKSCSHCGAVYEGKAVLEMFSCEQCGKPSLSQLRVIQDGGKDAPLPRSGSGGGLITHTRDSF